MNVIIALNQKTKIKIIPVFEGKHKEFKGEKGKTKVSVKENFLQILYGLGKEKEFELNEFRKIALLGLNKAAELKEKNYSVELPESEKFSSLQQAVALTDSFLYYNYFFDKYKKEDFKVTELVIDSKPSAELKNAVNTALKINESVILTRDLINENSEITTPLYLEKAARKHLGKKVKISVLKQKDLIKNKMNLFAAVGNAGTTPPQLTLLEYNGNPASKKKILLVGKGITFDSGGMDLKPAEYMLDMRDDMSGAATVLGIMKAVSELNLKVNLIAAMACAENLIDAKAYRPGDILTGFNGKTVEVKSTDAEGRLVLADTLAYCNKKYSPELIIDYATLTGACVVALSYHVAAMISNSDEFSSKLFESGQKVFERVWKLPLYDEFRDDVKGDRSDLQNLSKSGTAGTITAAAFLENFVDKTPWIHLDIAGTAFISKPVAGLKKGASGFGIKLTIDFLQKLIQEKKV
ncbi:MAG: leucyl aminopeptidase [Candidatus Diapherotrites archaeon]|nr:leucyl aminopeptidase [Candidatus Diapherotrites archaeon]